MASIVCLCKNVIRPHSFPNEGAYSLVSEVDYDSLPNFHLMNGQEAAQTVFGRGTEVYLCPSCGRLIVFWKKEDGTCLEHFYGPQGTHAQNGQGADDSLDP